MFLGKGSLSPQLLFTLLNGVVIVVLASTFLLDQDVLSNSSRESCGYLMELEPFVKGSLTLIGTNLYVRPKTPYYIRFVTYSSWLLTIGFAS